MAEYLSGYIAGLCDPKLQVQVSAESDFYDDEVFTSHPDPATLATIVVHNSTLTNENSNPKTIRYELRAPRWYSVGYDSGRGWEGRELIAQTYSRLGTVARWLTILQMDCETLQSEITGYILS